jgi:hypothetical protein
VLVQGKAFLVKPKLLEERYAMPRIFTGDTIHSIKYMQGAKSDVTQVANGCCHHVQSPSRQILLLQKI